MTLYGGDGSGVRGGIRSGLTSLAAGTVAGVPQILFCNRGCGPVVVVSLKPGILLADLSIASGHCSNNGLHGGNEERTTSRTSERGPARTSRQRDVLGMPAAAIAWWIEAYGGRGSGGKLEQGKVTYNKGIVLFFANPEERRELKVSSTGSFPTRVRNSLPILRFVEVLASLKGPFRTFVFLLNLP